MHIFMFKSQARSDLRAFAGDSSGSKLPAQHGPWQAIEKAISSQGFHLWPVKEPAKAG